MKSSDPFAQLELNTTAHWFVVYTSPRHEKSVARHLEYRDIDCFLPLYRVNRRWSDGSRVIVELPLFTGYVFVRIARGKRWRALDVPGAVAFVTGAGGEPAVLSETVIEGLRRGLSERTIEPHACLTVGQRVVIRAGALAGMEGVVVRNKSGLRVVVTIEHIMRSIAVEVSSRDIEIVPNVVPESRLAP